MNTVKIKSVPKKGLDILPPEAIRMREFRKHMKLTQKEMGDALNRDAPTITKYEKGQYIVPIEVIKLMHDKMDMDYEWFFSGLGRKRSKENPEENQKGSNLVKDITVLSSNQEVMAGVLKTLREEFKLLFIEFHALKQELKSKNSA